MPQSIDALVSHAAAGDPAALEALYRDLAPVVLGYLRGHGAQEPEDLLGEVFVGVVRGLGRFRGDADDLRSWVFTIAHRRLLDERRRAVRRPLSLLEPEELRDVPAPGGDAEEEAIGKLQERWALEALDALTTEQRDVVLLRFLADLSVREVARILGKNEGAVKTLTRRALARLQEHLDPEGVNASPFPERPVQR